VVVSVLDESSLIAACEHNKFQVAVVGQSVSAKVKRRIARMVRENCPNAKLLEIYNLSTGKVLEDADAWLEMLADVPQELAAQVEMLAAR